MSVTREEFSKIIDLLKKTPRGLNIGEIANAIHLNRISTAKYLDVLTAQGVIDVREMGKAKLFYISRTVPTSTLLKCTSDLIVVLNAEEWIIYANEPFLSYCMIPEGQILNRNVREVSCGILNAPETHVGLKEAADNREFRHELRVKHQGVERYFELHITPAALPDGSTGAILVYDDITKHRNHVKALEEIEQKYAVLAKKSRDIVFFVDADGYLASISPQAAQFCPRPDDLVSQKFDCFLPENDRNPTDCPLKNNPGTKTECIAVHRAHDTRGNLRWIECSISARRDQAGHPAGFTGIVRDITALKQMECKLRENEERTRHILANTREWIWEINPDGIFTFSNAAVQKFLGYSPEDLVFAMQYPDLFLPEKKEEQKNLTDGILQSKKPFNNVLITHRHREGSAVILEISGVPLFDEEGRFTGYRGIGRDLTGQYLSTEQLTVLRAEKDLLTVEIHDRVKNNLQIVMSLLILQGKKHNDDKVLAALAECQNRIWALSLVYETLQRSWDTPGIDLGKYIPDLAKHLSTIYGRDCGENVGFAIDTKGVWLDLDAAIPVGLILNELISNAFVHAFLPGQRGTITLAAQGGSTDPVMIVVSDNGVGLPPGLDW
ncbi:MAG: PAS domain S-box protein, partial [Methanoregula sp.]|nr:PAS domain S-box protein [Methanoregula sp.]